MSGRAEMDRSLEQTLALAGIAQAAYMVRQLAHHGVAAGEKFEVAVESLFVTDPRTTVQVYGSVRNLNLGLQVLQEIIDGNSAVYSADEVMKYIMGMLYLQNRLMKRKQMLKQISVTLEQLKHRYSELPRANNEVLIRQLAKLYQDTISTLSYRIQVKGDMQRLQNEYTAARIRVLLFAGIRSAVLWEQRGGKRWQLLFQRKSISRNINRLLLSPPEE